MLVKRASKDSETIINALIDNNCELTQKLYQSLAWDRGIDKADHKRFTLATDIDIYLCDPHGPWRRRINENTNGPLRQYSPNGVDISACSQT